MSYLQRWLAYGALLLLPALASAEAPPYNYPFDNPYVATVVGTPTDWHVRFEAPAPAKHYGLPPLEGRQVPEVFWYQDRMHYALAKQATEAPLIFIIAGTGAGYFSSKMQLLMNAYHQAGFHVVTLSSPTYPNFIVTASSSGIPGYLEEDAEDLYRVMERVWEKHRDKLPTTKFYLTGYSLGAANSAFVSALDEQRRVFNFEKVLLINPPVSLFNSVNLLDGMLPVSVDLQDLASINDFLSRMFDAVAALYVESDQLTLDEDTLYKLYNHSGKLPQKDLATLIGLAFRLSSADMVFTSDVIADRGYLKPQGLELGSADSLTDFYKAANRISFLQYFDEYFLPYFQQKIPGLRREELLEQLSLRPLDRYIRNSPKLLLATNADDLILDQGEIGYLEDLFGSRAKVFPSGGHCGNLAHPAFIAHITDSLRP